jgi:hypothetical protein
MGGECDRFGFLIMEGQALGPTDLVGLLGGALREVTRLLTELAEKRVFSRTGDVDLEPDIAALIPADMPAGVIFSRRMLRDKAKAENDRENGKGGGNPNLKPKDNGGVNPPDKAQKPEARSHEPEPPKSPKGDDDGFEAWYTAFPRHEGRGHALKAYRSALKKTSASTLLQAAERYRALRSGQDPKYTMLPATWLNGEHWSDEGQPQLSIVAPFENTDERGWRDRMRVFRERELWSPKWGPKPGEPGCKCPPHILDDGKEAA